MTKYEDFAHWVAKQIFFKEINDDLFVEIACRKLAKLGLVEKTDTEWVYVTADDVPETPPILHSHCIRCGKALKNPKAQERGYGEICWQKHLSDNQQALF